MAKKGLNEAVAHSMTPHLAMHSTRGVESGHGRREAKKQKAKYQKSVYGKLRLPPDEATGFFTKYVLHYAFPTIGIICTCLGCVLVRTMKMYQKERWKGTSYFHGIVYSNCIPPSFSKPVQLTLSLVSFLSSHLTRSCVCEIHARSSCFHFFLLLSFSFQFILVRPWLACVSACVMFVCRACEPVCAFAHVHAHVCIFMYVSVCFFCCSFTQSLTQFCT